MSNCDSVRADESRSPGSMPVRERSKEPQIHAPEFALPSAGCELHANFGSDGRTALNGFAFSPSALTPATGVSGVGSGTVTISASDGRSCSGSAFAWGLGSQP